MGRSWTSIPKHCVLGLDGENAPLAASCAPIVLLDRGETLRAKGFEILKSLEFVRRVPQVAALSCRKMRALDETFDGAIH